MKLLEKVTTGAGIALNYVAGVASIWFGAICSLVTLSIWGFAGVGPASAVFFALFGLTPIGGGIWLFRRGKIQRDLFKVKLLKESVRELAFQHHGRLRPIELAQARGYSEEQALDILKNLVAEDPERIELELDYESGELYFEFADILRAIETQRGYPSLPLSDTLGKKAVDIAQVLGKTVGTFYEYVEYSRASASEHHKQHKQHKQHKAEKYKQKVEQFLQEIEQLKHEEQRGV